MSDYTESLRAILEKACAEAAGEAYTGLQNELATARAAVERLRRELADATDLLTKAKRYGEEQRARADGLAAELDAIKAPRCLSDAEAMTAYDEPPGDVPEAVASVARAAERKLVGALLAKLNEPKGYLGCKVPYEECRKALTAIGAPAAEPAQPEPRQGPRRRNQRPARGEVVIRVDVGWCGSSRKCQRRRGTLS